MSLLIYGAYGYTGELIVDEALRRGLRPVIAGRSVERLRALEGRTGLETRACGLDDSNALRDMLRGIDVVIHAAGPFTITSKPMGKACLSAGVHYLDITGEIPVFEKLAAIDQRAKDAGIMMMPGTGFDVVPTDCLAAHLKRRLPSGSQLSLAIGTDGGGLSRGTIKTMLRHLGLGGIERVDGQLVSAPVGNRQRDVDFGTGPTAVISIPWGDLSTAYHSTGIPNITCFASYPPLMRAVATRVHHVAPVFRAMPVQAALHWLVGNVLPPGPTAEVRATARSLVWGELRDSVGNVVRARCTGPEGYALTATSAVDIALRTLAGEGKPGFQTPSRLLGPDYPLTLDGVDRVDLD
jgi:short subunit dehydrogenase-like uncharacterized protein